RGFDRAWVMLQLSQAQRLASVQRLMLPAPAGTPKNWNAYRERFVEPRRIAAGVAFWRSNEEALQRAESIWGVPPEIVVGIIGVETYFGRLMGRFRVLDALATLAFDYPGARPERAAFFRSELEEFLVYCRHEGLDPTQPTGSFAGAMGIPQFMPSSINRYAVDFEGSGHVDLAKSSADAIGSVAHFLSESGWQRGLPTHFAVTAPSALMQRAQLLVPDIRPTFSPAQFTEHGAVLEDAARGYARPLALVELENGGDAPSYVAGTENFYAITRYNRSSYYAMAVISLGEAIQRAR
ncbi:MAG: lytic murein transglycosylase B, partial [Burkholderiales bacterium]|nr:lytic murein transglycosylase B [Burkholderiales bacterium]